MAAPIVLLNSLSPSSTSALPTWVRCCVHWGRMWQRLGVYQDAQRSPALAGGVALNAVVGQTPAIRLAALCIQLTRETLAGLSAKDALYQQGLSWTKTIAGRGPSKSRLSLSDRREFSCLSPSLSLKFERVRENFEEWFINAVGITYGLAINALRLSASLLGISDCLRERSESEIQDSVHLILVNAQAIGRNFSKQGIYLIAEEFHSRADLIRFILDKLGVEIEEDSIRYIEEQIEQALVNGRNVLLEADATTRYLVPLTSLETGVKSLLHTVTGSSQDELIARIRSSHD